MGEAEPFFGMIIVNKLNISIAYNYTVLSVVSCLRNQSNYPVLSIIADRKHFSH